MLKSLPYRDDSEFFDPRYIEVDRILAEREERVLVEDAPTAPGASAGGGSGAGAGAGAGGAGADVDVDAVGDSPVKPGPKPGAMPAGTCMPRRLSSIVTGIIFVPSATPLGACSCAALAFGVDPHVDVPL